MRFEELSLSSNLLSAIKGLGITEPTEIQEQSIPHILEGKDVMGESATGSGKTLAFGCAIVERAVPGQGLQAVVLTPTRELAEQVKGSLKQLSAGKNLNILAVYGGVSINPQIDNLPRADVVVGTPGRMLDHLERNTIDLSKVNVFVLDEADRMFEMGFIEDVERIITGCPTKRQTLIFSATLSMQVKELARRYTIDAIEVSATNQVDPSKLKQTYYDIPKNRKISLLVYLLQKEKSGLAMVFCNTRRMTDFVAKNLKINRINAIAIHGGLTQNKRTRTIGLFNNARVGVLVCTDVAARGLHIDNVSHVYNYEIPKDATDYVHRIGRTARAGEEGKAINLICDYDYDNFSAVMENYRDFNIEKEEVPSLENVRVVRMDNQRRGGNSFGRNGSRRVSRHNSFGGYGSRGGSRRNSFGGYGSRHNSQENYGSREGSRKSQFGDQVQDEGGLTFA
ncbi:DEAD/DEAH box helicase [Candidatus Woesearchaeota archaeon]|nr:DEAD/DEAH box helicase [Candidatus Woesearchaeota archaeon]